MIGVLVALAWGPLLRLDAEVTAAVTGTVGTTGPGAVGRSPVRRWLVPAAVAGALAVGTSRVALGVHWASDVVSGWLLGTAVVLAALACVHPYRRDTGSVAARRRVDKPRPGYLRNRDHRDQGARDP